MSKAAEQRIADLITGDIAAMGYDLVRVHIAGGGKFSIAQIMADRQDGKGITVDDCAAINKKVLAILESDSDLAEKYDLEVSSPGIDRPLVRLVDYEKFCGHVAKVELDAPVNGKRRFQGKIVHVVGKMIVFEVEKTKLDVPFASIEKAKLVLTDELLKAATSGKVNH